VAKSLPKRAALDAFDRFIDDVASSGQRRGLFIDRRAPLAAMDAKALARFEKSWRCTVPADIAGFWRRGVANVTIEGADGEHYATTRFDAPGTAAARSARRIFQNEAAVHRDALAAEEYSPTHRVGDFERGRLFGAGFPLTQDENYIVWDTDRGGVWQTSGEPFAVPTMPIAATFAEFLHHYVAAGCFDCGTAKKRRFDAYWKLVKPLVPVEVAPRDNLWLRHLSRFYPGKDAIVPAKRR
jgi:hypothetical protein